MKDKNLIGLSDFGNNSWKLDVRWTPLAVFGSRCASQKELFILISYSISLCSHCCDKRLFFKLFSTDANVFTCETNQNCNLGVYGYPLVLGRIGIYVIFFLKWRVSFKKKLLFILQPPQYLASFRVHSRYIISTCWLSWMSNLSYKQV